MNERLKELRIFLGLTLEEFGNKIGFTRSSMSNIETGYRNVTDRLILAVCNTYNVNEEWFRTGHGEMFIESKNSYLSSLAKQYALDEKDIILIKSFLELEPNKRSVIKEYIVDIANNLSVDRNKPSEKEKIDAEVESYRKELENEIKGAVKLSVSESTNENLA